MASLVGTDRQPRRGLTTQQKLKGVLLFLHSATIKLQLPTRSAFGAQLNIPLTSALQQVVEELLASPRNMTGQSLCWLGTLASKVIERASGAPSSGTRTLCCFGKGAV